MDLEYIKKTYSQSEDWEMLEFLLNIIATNGKPIDELIEKYNYELKESLGIQGTVAILLKKQFVNELKKIA